MSDDKLMSCVTIQEIIRNHQFSPHLSYGEVLCEVPFQEVVAIFEEIHKKQKNLLSSIKHSVKWCVVCTLKVNTCTVF